MAGGKLVQDQRNPGTHLMKIEGSNSEILVTSTHHQAQYPFNLSESEDYKIIGWTEGLVGKRKNGYDEDLTAPKECEVVIYPKINALAIQPHPEYMIAGKTDDGTPIAHAKFEESVKWFQETLNNFLNS